MPMQGGEKMGTVWAQQREDLLSDCIVSPDVFIPMVDRLAEFVVPYQHFLETEAGQRNVHLSLQGLLSHLAGKNAEDIATFVDVQRQVMQEFIGTAPWEHRPLIEVLVAKAAAQFIGVCRSAKTGEIGEHLLSVSDPIARPQERLIHAGALIRPPTLQRRSVSSLHPCLTMERSPAAMSPVSEPRRRSVG